MISKLGLDLLDGRCVVEVMEVVLKNGEGGRSRRCDHSPFLEAKCSLGCSLP